MYKGRETTASFLLILIMLSTFVIRLAWGLPILMAGTFPSGTVLVPMDDKQVDRVRVYGFIHEFLRLTPGSAMARIIEPPDVTIQTALTPNGAIYEGGPFLIDPKFAPQINSLLSKSVFHDVTVTKLTASFTSNRIFFTEHPTKILVVFGVFGRTDLTLTRVGINYTLIDPDVVLNNPSIINQYSLIIVDCPGFVGHSSYDLKRQVKIQSVYNAISSHVQAGNEVIYTDAALLDMNSTFPGYLTLSQSEIGSWETTFHNPPKRYTLRPDLPDYPASHVLSQYYNSGGNADTVKVFTAGDGWVVSGVKPSSTSDVRVLIDSDKFGTPHRHAILAFYFQYGNGLVEGLAFHPHEQTFPNFVDQNGYYATDGIIGNSFIIASPDIDFVVGSTPTSVTIPQGQSATYTLTVFSVGSFSYPVTMQLGGSPINSLGSFSLPLVTPAPGGITTVSLTVSTSMNTPIGTYNMTVSGMAFGLDPIIVHQTFVTLIVVARPPPDFGLSVKPSATAPLIVQLGQCGNYYISVRSIGNFTSPIDFTIANIPAKVTAKFITSGLSLQAGMNSSSVLQICPATDAVPGDYSMTIVGTSGAVTHSVAAILEIHVMTSTPLDTMIYSVIVLVGLGIGLLTLLVSKRTRK